MSANPIRVINRLIDVQDQVGAFIAGPDRDGLAGYVQQQYRTRCNQAANIPSWLTNLSTPARETLSNFCQPWYDQQGVDGFEATPSLVTGGQCPGVNYSVQVQQNRADNGNPAPLFTLGTFTGPIRSAAPVNPPVNCSTPGNDANNYYRFEDGAGNPIYQSNSCSAFQQNPQLICTPLGPEPPGGCGAGEPDLRPGPNPPPDPGPLPGPEPTDGPDGSPFPELPIPDFPSPFGDFPVVAPPEEPVAVDPTTIPPTGGDGLPGLPDAIAAPAGEVSGGEDGEEIIFGAPPEGRIWVGCSIEATVDARLGNIPGTGPESTVYAFVIGNAALRYGSFYGTSKRINSRFTLLGRETTAVIVDGCFVQAQPGVTLVVRPISAETCPESPCST